ncbi:MAG: chemotaxis protein CheB [Deltaproteobacteria bacterium]
MKSAIVKKKAPVGRNTGNERAARSATTIHKGGKFPIVCIGASAGGLEAFVQLLENLPPDRGMAYILVQHLDPRHESMLAGIISRATRMPVIEVKDGMRVRPDHVYVIPPNVDMAILHGSLSLMPRPEKRGPHLAIDYFLRSLARDQKDQAIAVILSGTASDGAQGVKEIKGEAGITFAQDEKSAKYPGMPLSAIATGCIDFILPPKEIARELGRIGRHPYLAVKKAIDIRAGEAEGDEDTNKVYILIRDATGLDFSLYKQTMMRRRILRRMVLHKLERIKDYVRFLQENPLEVTALYQDFLINVTSFFRDAETFQMLKRRVFPHFLKGRKPSSAIRIWVPGCSTGEEAYSIGIVLMESMGGGVPAGPIQIFGTDIDERSIEKARTGIYPDSIAEDVSPERLRRFFVESDHGYQVSKSIRDMCIFARQNLIKDPPFSKIDLISCRNVLIYMKPVLQRRVLSIFHYALRPSGFLLLGTSESIGELADLYKTIDRQSKIYVRKEGIVHPPAEFALTMASAGLMEPVKRGEEFYVRSLEKVHRDADRIALERYAPPGVLVNDQMAILQFRGETAPYLSPAPGRASLNLLRMAREGMAAELRKAIERAKTDKRPVRKEGFKVRHEEKERKFNLEVIPIRSSTANEYFYMVLFDEEVRHSASPAGVTRRLRPLPGTKAAKEKPSSDASRIVELERELSSIKEYLRTVLDEQESSNEAIHAASEEIQSSNEELQSTNEELETAKEELQSTNEELTTLNEEMANRNLELTSANNDLLNLLASVQLPIVMLEADLRIRRITPPAEKVLNLIPADVGRPLRDINMSIAVPDLEKKVLDAVDRMVSLEEEVQDRDGNLFIMAIKPYMTPERKIDGAILSFMEIGRLKQSYEKLARALGNANAIIETTREPLMVMDDTLRVRTVNRAFCNAFRVRREDTEGRLLEEVGKGEWSDPRLRDLLMKVLTQDQQIRDYKMDGDFPRVGYKKLLLNAQRISSVEGNSPIIFLSIEDSTAGPQGMSEAEAEGTAPAKGDPHAERKRPSR